ncbi:MAG: sigma factor-like helix-turn-helix DNA-binding protein [Ruminococcus sp.]
MTTEEKRTVELLRQNGKSNAEIAEHLHISPNTIKSYLKRKKRSDNSCLMCGITITQTPHRKKKNSAPTTVDRNIGERMQEEPPQ